jgi:hypothetical protein
MLAVEFPMPAILPEKMLGCWTKVSGELNCKIETEVNSREATQIKNDNTIGFGRELFGNLRALVSGSEDGASFLI